MVIFGLGGNSKDYVNWINLKNISGIFGNRLVI